MPVRWSSVQDEYSPELQEHWTRAQAVGLECPLDVFEQLFFDHHEDKELAGILRYVEWNSVRWVQGHLSGVALRHTAVPREYRPAVDEARLQTLQEGFFDERAEVMQHWGTAHTWIRPPIVVSGDVLESVLQYELIVGFTRLGNLLGALDRQDIPEAARHQLWIGTTELSRGAS